ncbi:hypothetical protein [Rhodococcus globerulus]|uniref:hypothetical protein n=1 Tax=Rhodococcus globerulus TaxID=33008 RepID=UPI000AE0D633|nr:hypothetical protein [Rhodococcus globerulus]
MQESQTTTPSSESNAEGVSTDSGNTGTPDIETGSQKGNREARYRTERNAAREELTTAQARIERMQRVEVERIAGEHLSMPGDLLGLTGNEVADYLDDDGNVDSAKVAADVAAVLTERPGLRKNAPAFDPTQGTGGNKPKASSPSWRSMFQ